VTDAVRAHLDATVRAWLGLPASADIVLPRLPDDLARRLLRLEELENPQRDQWGCWEYAFCESFNAGRLWEPDVDRWVAEQRAQLAGRVELEPLWPDGKTFAVCMTHDVDLISRVSTPRQALRSLRTSLADDPKTARERAVRLARPPVRAVRAMANGISRAPAADTLELSVRLERERGVTASYFFTVYPGDDASRFDCLYDFADACRFDGERVRVRDVLQHIRANGFDVGLHGSYNSALVPGLLARERDAVARAAGEDVTTTRQHFLHWDVRTTPRLQADAGIRADSTVGFNRNLGFRAGTSLPFRLFYHDRDEPLDLLEAPLVIADAPILRADGLELGTELGTRAIAQLVDAVAESGGVATMVFHPNNLEHSDYRELFEFALDYGLERRAWFASLRELDEWWRAREQRLAT
jgi:hypothetical protein